jgi:hypothetical protein
MADNFSKNVNLPHFSCVKRKLSVKNYSKMYSKMSLTLKSIVEKIILWNYRLLLLSMIDFFKLSRRSIQQREANLGKVAPIPPVIFFGHGSARHSVGSTTYCAGLRVCKKTAIALPARYTALAAATIPIR